jgi:hypothetical protein
MPTGAFTSVTLPAGSIGSELAVNNNVIRTTSTNTSACAYVQAPFANPKVTVYYNRQPSGGVAEVRTSSSLSSLSTCKTCGCETCGSINSYSPVVQYQVPHGFSAPVQAGDYIAICQTGARVAGSTGYTLELDAVLFR